MLKNIPCNNVITPYGEISKELVEIIKAFRGLPTIDQKEIYYRTMYLQCIHEQKVNPKQDQGSQKYGCKISTVFYMSKQAEKMLKGTLKPLS